MSEMSKPTGKSDSTKQFSPDHSWEIFRVKPRESIERRLTHCQVCLYDQAPSSPHAPPKAPWWLPDRPNRCRQRADCLRWGVWSHLPPKLNAMLLVGLLQKMIALPFINEPTVNQHRLTEDLTVPVWHGALYKTPSYSIIPSPKNDIRCCAVNWNQLVLMDDWIWWYFRHFNRHFCAQWWKFDGNPLIGLSVKLCSYRMQLMDFWMKYDGSIS